MSTFRTPELNVTFGSETLRAVKPPADLDPYSDEAVGNRLELIRLAMGWENKFLAQQIGISAQLWGNYKAGTNKFPTAVARRLQKITGAEYNYIYSGERAYLPAHFLEKLIKAEATPEPAPKRRAKRA